MATKRQRKNGTWEYRFKNKELLPKPFYATFDTETEGDIYAANLEALLREGKVPPDVLEATTVSKESDIKTIADLISAYEKTVNVADSDAKILSVIAERNGNVKLGAVTVNWAEVWIADMKHRLNLVPSTIRHHVGALARCFDWGENRNIVELVRHPLRRLTRGYATYNNHDARIVTAKGGVVKHHTKRNRRLEDGEEVKIRHVLTTHTIYETSKAIVINNDKAMVCMLDIALETAMRMREIFTLTVNQVDINNRTIFLDKTKNGDSRQVPLTTVVTRILDNYIKDTAMVEGRLFPWWNGSPIKDDLKRTSTLISQQFKRIFEAAGCKDLHFHDLRHEATSRFFELTEMDSIEIAKITGHKDPRMLMIYANLRANRLVKKLW